MKRMKPSHTVTLYGATGTGPTAAAAKAHAIQKIAQAFTDQGDYAPRLTRFPDGLIGLVFRSLDGWGYDLLHPDTTQRTCYGQQMGLASAKLADVHMRRAVAQEYVFTTEDQGTGVLQDGDTEGLRDHQHYVRFQVAYRQYADEGKPDHECHHLACDASGAA